jgi:nitrogen fixation NifU-like protein
MMYNDKVLDHFKNPRNMGEMKDADAIGEYGNPICGDMMFIYIKVGERNRKDYIKDISFQTFGCAAAIATSSMITELAKGKTLEEAKTITRNDVANSLGGLPPQKLHCSNLAADALHDAIKNYYSKKVAQ